MPWLTFWPGAQLPLLPPLISLQVFNVCTSPTVQQVLSLGPQPPAPALLVAAALRWAYGLRMATLALVPAAQLCLSMLDCSALGFLLHLPMPSPRQAWDAGQPVAVHGLVYALSDGILKVRWDPMAGLVVRARGARSRLSQLKASLRRNFNIADVKPPEMRKSQLSPLVLCSPRPACSPSRRPSPPWPTLRASPTTRRCASCADGLR